jgi:hypothetical protein
MNDFLEQKCITWQNVIASFFDSLDTDFDIRVINDIDQVSQVNEVMTPFVNLDLSPITCEKRLKYSVRKHPFAMHNIPKLEFNLWRERDSPVIVKLSIELDGITKTKCVLFAQEGMEAALELSSFIKSYLSTSNDYELE